LYGYTAKNETFKKIASGVDGWYLYDNHQYVILDSGVGYITLYGINNLIVFNVRLPKNVKIELKGELCIYEMYGKWRAMEFINGNWQETILGCKGENDLPWPYYRFRTNSEETEIRFIIDGKVHLAGVFKDAFAIKKSNVVLLRNDGYYEMLSLKRPSRIIADNPNAFSCDGGLMIWEDKKKGWSRHEGFAFWGYNAVYVLKMIKQRLFMELYEYDGQELVLMAKGAWKWENNQNNLIIDGMIYSKNPKTDKVDFDNPKPTVKRRIKDFVKNLFK